MRHRYKATPIILLFLGFALLFATAVTAGAVMSLSPEDEGAGGGGGSRRPVFGARGSARRVVGEV
ncbi:MAG: hypothetical protein P4M15_08585, partial [Alphaproteobacteria bacterium]|nr:hypothetical protein [Alphaproteobacteria bacterium]